MKIIPLLVSPSFLFLASVVYGQIDLDGDGLSDLWQLRYQLQSASPSEDSDGDGMSNAEEDIAGTNPLDATSVFEAPIIEIGSEQSSIALYWNGVGGKGYSLEHSSTLSGWQTEGGVMVSLGGEEQVSISVADSVQFWRIAVQDSDRDGDGLTDHEEVMLGLDPDDASSATASGGGDDVSGGDLAYAVSLLTSDEPFSVDGVMVQGLSLIHI